MVLQTQEGELGLSPRGRGLSTRESPAARKGVDLHLHSQSVPSPASSPALLGATNGSRLSGLSGSHQNLPSSNWVSSSPGSFAPLSSSSMASPPESPRSGSGGLGGSAVSVGVGTSPAPRRKTRRLSAATPMSPSGAHGGLLVPTSGSLSANSLPSTPTSRRFRLFGGGKASDSGEEDNIGPSKASPTATSALQAQLSMRGDGGETDSGGEEESAEGSGSSRRRGLSFTRRSKKTEVSKGQDDSEVEREKEKEREREKDHRASKMKRTGSFVVLSSRLDKKTGESGRKLSGKDDSETKPASGSGKVRKRSEGDAAAAKAPPSFGSEGSGSLDEDDNDEQPS